MRIEPSNDKGRTALIAALCAVIVVSIGFTVSRGCRTGDDHMVTRPLTEADVQKRITSLQNDPHMPQFAKDAAIGQLKGRLRGGRP